MVGPALPDRRDDAAGAVFFISGLFIFLSVARKLKLFKDKLFTVGYRFCSETDATIGMNACGDIDRARKTFYVL